MAAINVGASRINLHIVKWFHLFIIDSRIGPIQVCNANSAHYRMSELALHAAPISYVFCTFVTEALVLIRNDYLAHIAIVLIAFTSAFTVRWRLMI